jgi:hypothetical protein
VAVLVCIIALRDLVAEILYKLVNVFMYICTFMEHFWSTSTQTESLNHLYKNVSFVIFSSLRTMGLHDTCGYWYTVK